jgi:hydrogenase expression/formation protein HypC
MGSVCRKYESFLWEVRRAAFFQKRALRKFPRKSVIEVNMCLAVPMELTEITMDGVGKVNAGGVGTAVNLMMVPHAKIGDFLIIHAGFAIEVLNDDEARIRLDLFRELAAATANLEEY